MYKVLKLVKHSRNTKYEIRQELNNTFSCRKAAKVKRKKRKITEINQICIEKKIITGMEFSDVLGTKLGHLQ